MTVKHKTIIRPVAPSVRPIPQPMPTPVPRPAERAPVARITSFAWPTADETAARHARQTDGERTFGERWDTGEIGWDDHDQVVVY